MKSRTNEEQRARLRAAYDNSYGRFGRAYERVSTMQGLRPMTDPVGSRNADMAELGRAYRRREKITGVYLRGMWAVATTVRP
jgi:hypothetical protein